MAYHGGAKLKVSYASTNLVSKPFVAIVVSLLSYQLSERAVDVSSLGNGLI